MTFVDVLAHSAFYGAERTENLPQAIQPMIELSKTIGIPIRLV